MRVRVITVAGLFVWAVVASSAWAATGDILADYQSSLGTAPDQQGWDHEGRCLKSDCPANNTSQQCRWQGWLDVNPVDGVSDNNCTLGIGCHSAVEHANLPPEPTGFSGTCTYTEWLGFDDGEDYLQYAYRVPLPNRNLTFTPIDEFDTNSTYWGSHAHPAFGAISFTNPPASVPLRIVSGDGIPNVGALPANSSSNRNSGKTKPNKGYVVPEGVNAVTLLARVAAGNRPSGHEMVQLRAFNKAFSFGVNGIDGDPDLGRFYNSDATDGEGSNNLGMFGTRTVQVALAQLGVWGPQAGEFFTIRIILFADGSVSAWLNEDETSLWNGTAGNKSSGPVVQLTPDENGGATAWVEYLTVMEGAVPIGNGPCPSLVFDVSPPFNRVDNADFVNGTNGFADCATGPAPEASVFDALSQSCKCMDVNDDAAIDMTDYAVFQRCISTGAAAADPTCDDLP